MGDLKYEFDEVESCELIGSFDDEYVYDVEVDDDTHTFIANDILVHNSLFVSFSPAIDNSDWKNLFFNKEYLDSITETCIILTNDDIRTKNPNCFITNDINEFENLIKNDYKSLLIDGFFVKNRFLNKMIDDGIIRDIKWNWSSELDLIQGIDKFRFADYFRISLEEYAASFGVTNCQDFELERISESILNVAKKKYIQHILFEDGINYDRLSYIFPKGVELIRSSTPYFAREKIVDIVKYLFSHPVDFNIKDLLKLVKDLRREFELADVEDISMQSSCNKYTEKVLEDKTKLSFVNGTHFSVKAGAYYNLLLNRNKELQEKYEFIKSGTKIKYYYCKDIKINKIFAFMRGTYPIEMAPEVDYDLQFAKCILSPINSIIEPLGLPEITKRLTVVMGIFGGLNIVKKVEEDEDEEDEEDFYKNYD